MAAFTLTSLMSSALTKRYRLTFWLGLWAGTESTFFSCLRWEECFSVFSYFSCCYDLKKQTWQKQQRKKGMYFGAQCKSLSPITSLWQELETANHVVSATRTQTAVHAGCSASCIHSHNPEVAPGPSHLNADKIIPRVMCRSQSFRWI